MSEVERDDSHLHAYASGLLVLLLKLWFILMVILIGLWTLGVILMYWYVVIPAGIVMVAWASRSSLRSPHASQACETFRLSAWACGEPSSEDGR